MVHWHMAVKQVADYLGAPHSGSDDWRNGEWHNFNMDCFFRYIFTN